MKNILHFKIEIRSTFSIHNRGHSTFELNDGVIVEIHPYS